MSAGRVLAPSAARLPRRPTVPSNGRVEGIADAATSACHRRSILVIEQDLSLARAIVEQLVADGFPARSAQTAEHARVLASASGPRLAVLGSLDSPREVIELLEEIRGSDGVLRPWDKGLPAIVLASQARLLDMLRAFDAGADDFLAKPARYLELRARIKAVLRRSENALGHRALLEVGALVIDTRPHLVSLRGRAIELRRMEFELLVYLAVDPVRVFTKEELLREVWGYRVSGSTRTLDSHASRLRRKLGGDGNRRWVINV